MIVEHSFAELRAAFERDFPTKDFFQGKHFNYYKLFQHGSSYCALNDQRKLVGTTIDQDQFIGLKYLVKQLSRRRASVKLGKYVVFDDHRTIETSGGRKSYYLNRILGLLEPEDVSIVQTSNRESVLQSDLEPNGLNSFSNHRLLAREKEVLADLRGVLSAFKSRLPGDKGHLYRFVASAFTVFFSDFHRYYHLFRNQKARLVLFTCHYHNEGMIAAARMHGIRLVELQHGLINTEDLYYVYKDRIADEHKDALFPDSILVFGSYWKQLLLKGTEFRADQIVVAGDYSLRSEGRMRYSSAVKANAILVATQKNCGHLYIPYIKHLKSLIAERHPDWMIWVKLHPHEKSPSDYDELEEGEHCKLYGAGTDIMELIAACRIQISIYSTTLYDALGLDVVNFALQNYGSLAEYAQTMVDEGVALPLAFDDDPVERSAIQGAQQVLQEMDVYAPFKPQSITEIVKSVG